MQSFGRQQSILLCQWQHKNVTINPHMCGKFSWKSCITAVLHNLSKNSCSVFLFAHAHYHGTRKVLDASVERQETEITGSRWERQRPVPTFWVPVGQNWGQQVQANVIQDSGAPGVQATVVTVDHLQPSLPSLYVTSAPTSISRVSDCCSNCPIYSRVYRYYSGQWLWMWCVWVLGYR